MRMKRLALIFLAVAIIWLTVLFLFSNNLGEQNRKTFYSHLTKLENGIQDQFKSNNQIIKEAQEYLEQQQDLAQELHEKKEENQEIAITNPRGPVVESPEGKLPVLVFACNRVSITRCLDKLLQYRPDPDKFPIIVSQVSC